LNFGENREYLDSPGARPRVSGGAGAPAHGAPRLLACGGRGCVSGGEVGGDLGVGPLGGNEASAGGGGVGREGGGVGRE